MNSLNLLVVINTFFIGFLRESAQIRNKKFSNEEKWGFPYGKKPIWAQNAQIGICAQNLGCSFSALRPITLTSNIRA